MRKLTEIAHDSDKTAYLKDYERVFAALADSPIVLLELGIGSGASLRLWCEYFPKARIVGVDERPVAIEDATGRIRCFQGRQEDVSFLQRIARETAPEGFDVIIDDAAHIGALASASFWFLFENHLKPGGIYVIEDWGTGYWPEWPDGGAFAPGHSQGMVGFVKDLVDECGCGDATHPVHGTPPPRNSRIGRLEVLPGLVIVFKPSRGD